MRRMIIHDPEIDIFIDELTFTRSNIQRAFDCINTLMSLCNNYIWVVCKRDGSFLSTDNVVYNNAISKLQNDHDAVIPQLTNNLRSSGVVTDIVQRVAAASPIGLYDVTHPTPAIACHSTNDRPLLVIHAPYRFEDAEISKQVLTIAINKGVNYMSINPLDNRSTDCLVVIVDTDGIYNAVCSILTGSRVVRYYFTDDFNIDECMYEQCTDMLQSLHSVRSQGGVLITCTEMFSGSEASHVLYIGCSAIASDRDAALRCVSDLVYIDMHTDGSIYKTYLSVGATDGGMIIP